MPMFSSRDLSELTCSVESSKLRLDNFPSRFTSFILPKTTGETAVPDCHFRMCADGMASVIDLRSTGAAPSESPVGGKWKRALDLTVAVGALVALAPLLAIIAVAVKLTMGGPVIYRHQRVGFGGKLFDCLKFRTMTSDGDIILQRYIQQNPAAAEEWRTSRKLAKDPRVTRFGCFLRKTSLDELPQFLNIVRGEMSCVGPRPVVVAEMGLYGEYVPAYLSARPGVTGLWQISGRSRLSYQERVKLDAEYVRGWTFGRDVAILMRTLPAVMKVDQAV
jgi:exopolysaccharide production protein ExoY